MRRSLWLVAMIGCGGGVGGGSPDASAIDSRLGDALLPDARPPSTVFLDPDTLHDIAITIAPSDLVLFDQDQTARVHCDVTIDGAVLLGCGCRKKGGVGSIDTASGKPAFSIKLDEYVPGQKYLGVDKIVLDNAIQDPSLLHEHLAYDVFRRAGIPAHRTAFALTSLNGEPRGVYIAVEPVDKEFLRLRYGATNGNGNLYESSTVDFALDPNGMELKDAVGRSRDDITAAAAAVDQTPDETFASVVGALIDLPAFAAFFAVEIAIDAEDGLAFGRNNYLMYHRPDTDRFVFLPHGQDVIMENAALDPRYPPGPRLSARVNAIPALRKDVDAALTAAIASGGAADPSYVAERIAQGVAVVTSTTRTDDFTAGDVAAMTRTAPVLTAQFAWRATWIAGTAALPFCGDGVVQGGEQCDDGNSARGDGCDDQCLPECTAPFSEAGGSWRLCPARRDWAAQVTTCEAFGGVLAYPTSAADSQVLASVVRRRLSSEDFWLGLTDASVEGVWRTRSGSTAPYLVFAPNEPNGGASENCMATDTGLYRDRACDQGLAALCRMP